MSAPANTTADRLGNVVAGQFVHTDTFTLTSALPADGWREVETVDRDAASVLLSFVDGTVFVAAADRLVRIGWGNG